MPREKAPKNFSRRIKAAVFLLVTLTFLAGGYLAAEWRAGIVDRELRNGLLTQAVNLVRAINPENVKALSFSEEDKNLPEFVRLAFQLKAFQTVTPYRGIWTLGLRDDSLIIGPESYADSDPLASPPGTVYQQPTTEIRDIFRTGHPFVQGPYSDEYGTFVSAFAPVLHQRSGAVLMVVGVDMEADDWNSALMLARLVSAACMAIPAAILLAGVIFLRYRSRLQDRNKRRFRFAEAWIVAALGLAVTGVGALVFHDKEVRSRQAAFRHLAEARAALVSDAFYDLRDYKIDAIARFFKASQYVERDEFHDFTAPMARRFDIQALAWIRAIPEVEKDRWMRQAGSEGMGGFRIWQKGVDGEKIYPTGRDIYYPVWYIEPVEGNEEALGFDVRSEPARRAALETAIDTGLSTATEPVTLVHEKENETGLLVFKAVFFDGPLEGLLRGVVVAALRFAPFLQTTLSTGLLDNAPAVVSLYQLTPESTPLYLSSCSMHIGDVAGNSLREELIHREKNVHSTVFPLFVFGKAYALAVSPTPALLAANPLKAGIVTLFVGVIFTVFLALFVLLLLHRRSELESLVQTRTAELYELNLDLERRVDERTEELKKAKAEAEHANRAKSDFLSAMSHEIRTPMNGVIGMIDVLEQSSLKKHQIEMVDTMRESALSLLSIIEDILDLSKIEAGKLNIQSAPINIEKVVEGLCDMLDRIAMKNGVDLTLFIDPAIPAEVIGDSMRLRQVLVNLVNNAIKFSAGQAERGRVAVRVVQAETDPGQVVEFSVIDNGIGMDEKTLSRLFEPFFSHGDASSTRRYGGTGLGLPISKRLLELMGGEMRIESSLGAGSTFTVRVPFEAADTGTRKSSFDFNGVSCLIVGGPGSGVEDLAPYLTFEGVPVHRAADIESAGSLISSLEPGVWVWIIGNEFGPRQMEKLKREFSNRSDLNVRFVVICRGRRRRLRRDAYGFITLDFNIMHRSKFLKAVAAAAGRTDLEEDGINAGEDPTSASPLSPVEASKLDKLILVAEDNETNQKVILQQLHLLGYAADIVSNGREAMEKLREAKYSLLLSDIHMPEMDGYELARAIRAMEGDSGSVPIIAFTANVTGGEIARCKAAGMNDYLAKPVRLGHLKTMLEKWLKKEPQSREAPERLMPKETESLEPVDTRVLAGFVGDDPDIVREFLQDFRKSAAAIAGELRRAMLDQDPEWAGNAAHKLKPSARAVGATALGDLCAQIEQAGKNRDLNVLDVLLPQLDTEMARVDAFISGILE